MELLNLSSRLNVPLSQLSSLLSPVTIKSDISQTVPNSNNFKFPATNNHDNNKLTARPNGMMTHRRVNSPARIGANAVASLANNNNNNGNRDNMIIKEEEDGDEDTQIDNNSAISPLTRKLPTFHNYIASRDNVYNAKPIRHSRNLSLPSMNKFTNNNINIVNSSSPHIPEGMTSILSFNNVSNDTFIEKPKPESAHNSNLKILEKPHIANTLKSNNSIQKKQHRRAKSACGSSAFSVIDLNITDENSKNKKNKIVVEEAKRKALIANILAYGNKDNSTTTTITSKTGLKISKEKKEFDEMDEKTCSESSSSSSKCQSPSNYNNTHTRTTSSVQKLLND